MANFGGSTQLLGETQMLREKLTAAEAEVERLREREKALDRVVKWARCAWAAGADLKAPLAILDKLDADSEDAAEDPYRKTVQRPTKITTRRLGSSGPLPSVPPLTLGPDGIWRRSEPVEAR
jgi:hypothetical protein